MDKMDDGGACAPVINNFIVQARQTEANVHWPWELQIEAANGSCKWKLQMGASNGSCKWKLRMEAANGSCKWELQMEAANDDENCLIRYNGVYTKAECT